jgi:hypothetical protein
MITAALGLDVSRFNKGVADARGALNSLAAQATSFGGPIDTLFGQLDNALGLLGKFGKSPAGAALMGIAAGATAAGIAMNGMWNAMSRSDELNTLSEQAGLSIKDFMTLEKVLSSAGLSAGRIPSIMDSLSSAMQSASSGTGEAALALRKLNLNFSDVSSLKGVDQIQKINNAINKLQSDSDKIQLRKIFFGKTGIAAGPEMTEEKLGKASAAVAPMANLFEQFGGVFAAFQANVKKIFVAFEPFFAGMATQVVPALVVATQDLMSAAPIFLKAGIEFGSFASKLFVVVEKMLKGFELINSMNPFKKTDPNAGMGKGVFQQLVDGFLPIIGKSKQMNAEELTKWEEARKAQLIPGYAEQTGATEDAALTFEERMKKVVESYQKPKEQGTEITKNIGLGSMGKGADVTAGLSSLAKMGAIGGGGPIVQDPLAMRSVSIQEDIRNYMRDLVNIVKSPENLSIQSSGTGMVLAS